MVYEVMMGYANGERTVTKQIMDVEGIIIENGAHTFLDENADIIFTAPSDSIIYVQRISLG